MLFRSETKRFVTMNLHVILSQQTCDQRSSMVVGSQRRASGNYFHIRVCYMFVIPKCRGELEPCLCTTSVLANRMTLRGGDFRLAKKFGRKICRNLPMLRGILFTSTEIMHRLRSNCPLHFDTTDIWQIRKQK